MNTQSNIGTGGLCPAPARLSDRSSRSDSSDPTRPKRPSFQASQTQSNLVKPNPTTLPLSLTPRFSDVAAGLGEITASAVASPIKPIAFTQSIDLCDQLDCSSKIRQKPLKFHFISLSITFSSRHRNPNCKRKNLQIPKLDNHMAKSKIPSPCLSRFNVLTF
jgi:hypothetical protein